MEGVVDSVAIVCLLSQNKGPSVPSIAFFDDKSNVKVRNAFDGSVPAVVVPVAGSKLSVEWRGTQQVAVIERGDVFVFSFEKKKRLDAFLEEASRRVPCPTPATEEWSKHVWSQQDEVDLEQSLNEIFGGEGRTLRLSQSVLETGEEWDPVEALVGTLEKKNPSQPQQKTEGKKTVIDPRTVEGMRELLQVLLGVCVEKPFQLHLFKETANAVAKAWNSKYARENDVTQEVEDKWDIVQDAVQKASRSQVVDDAERAIRDLLMAMNGGVDPGPRAPFAGAAQATASESLKASLRTSISKVQGMRSAALIFPFSTLAVADVVVVVSDDGNHTICRTAEGKEVSIPRSFLRMLPSDVVVGPMRASRAAKDPSKSVVKPKDLGEGITQAQEAALSLMHAERADREGRYNAFVGKMQGLHVRQGFSRDTIDAELEKLGDNLMTLSIPALAEALKSLLVQACAMVGHEPESFRSNMLEFDSIAGRAAMMALESSNSEKLLRLKEFLKDLVQWAELLFHNTAAPIDNVRPLVESLIEAIQNGTERAQVRAVWDDLQMALVSLVNESSASAATDIKRCSARLFTLLDKFIREQETASGRRQSFQHSSSQGGLARPPPPGHAPAIPEEGMGRWNHSYAPINGVYYETMTTLKMSKDFGFPLKRSQYESAPTWQEELDLTCVASHGISADNTGFLLYGMIFGSSVDVAAKASATITVQETSGPAKLNPVSVQTKLADPPKPRWMTEFAILSKDPFVLHGSVRTGNFLIRKQLAGDTTVPVYKGFNKFQLPVTSPVDMAVRGMPVAVDPAHKGGAQAFRAPKVRVVLARDVYYPGETVEGIVALSVRAKSIDIRSFSVEFFGHHIKTNYYMYSSGSSTYTKVVHEPDVFFSNKVELATELTHLPPGQWAYRFKLKLPTRLPASSEVLLFDRVGSKISYGVRVEMQEPTKSRLEIEENFRVVYPKFDLPDVQDAPMSLSFPVRGNGGAAYLTLQISSSSAVEPGESIPFTLVIRNETKSVLKKACVSTLTVVRTQVGNHGNSDSFKSPATDIPGIHVEPGTMQQYDGSIRMPDVKFHTFSYPGAAVVFKVVVDVPGVGHVSREVQVQPKLGPLDSIPPPIYHDDRLAAAVEFENTQDLPWYFFCLKTNKK